MAGAKVRVAVAVLPWRPVAGTPPLPLCAEGWEAVRNLTLSSQVECLSCDQTAKRNGQALATGTQAHSCDRRGWGGVCEEAMALIQTPKTSQLGRTKTHGRWGASDQQLGRSESVLHFSDKNQKIRKSDVPFRMKFSSSSSTNSRPRSRADWAMLSSAAGWLKSLIINALPYIPPRPAPAGRRARSPKHIENKREKNHNAL